MAVIVSLATTITVHLLMPINFRSYDKDEDETPQERSVEIMPIEACPEDG